MEILNFCIILYSRDFSVILDTLKLPIFKIFLKNQFLTLIFLC